MAVSGTVSIYGAVVTFSGASPCVPVYILMLAYVYTCMPAAYVYTCMPAFIVRDIRHSIALFWRLSPCLPSSSSSATCARTRLGIQKGNTLPARARAHACWPRQHVTTWCVPPAHGTQAPGPARACRHRPLRAHGPGRHRALLVAAAASMANMGHATRQARVGTVTAVSEQQMSRRGSAPSSRRHRRWAGAHI